MLILGIDDAGRGPLIGPMILSGVLVTPEQEANLKELGAKDSKTILHPTRVRLAKEIESNSIDSKTLTSSPNEIDSSITSGTNLNTLEAKKAAQIINTLNPKSQKVKVIVDCPSVNTTAWRNTLLGFIDNPQNLEIRCEHKADANHPAVSAASILAKVKREEEVLKLKSQYGSIGSGYPSDPTTKAFLKKHGKQYSNSGIFRKTWSTWRNMFPEDSPKMPQKPKYSKPSSMSSKSQKKIFDY